jgi:plasmid stabilization system protein ParE
MVFKVIWSKFAVKDYSQNVDYLLKEWTLTDAQEFANNAENIINIISKMPESFPLSDYKNVRKATVCKQISLLYKINKTEIILLRFWNNKQSPQKIKF